MDFSIVRSHSTTLARKQSKEVMATNFMKTVAKSWPLTVTKESGLRLSAMIVKKWSPKVGNGDH